MVMAVLISLGSVAGAVSVVAGLMLVFGSINSADFTRGDITSAIDGRWGWWLNALVLTVCDIIAQAAGAARAQTIRAAWYSEATV